MDKLKNNRAPGPDNNNSELMKMGKPVLIKLLHRIIQEVWTSETIPQEWEKGLFAQYIRKVIH